MQQFLLAPFREQKRAKWIEKKDKIGKKWKMKKKMTNQGQKLNLKIGENKNEVEANRDVSVSANFVLTFHINWLLINVFYWMK